MQVLQIDNLIVSHTLDGLHEAVLGLLRTEAAIADMNWSIIAMHILVNLGIIMMIRLKLLKIRQYLLSRPSLCIPGVKVVGLGSGIHHEIDA